MSDKPLRVEVSFLCVYLSYCQHLTVDGWRAIPLIMRAFARVAVVSSDGMLRKFLEFLKINMINMNVLSSFSLRKCAILVNTVEVSWHVAFSS